MYIAYYNYTTGTIHVAEFVSSDGNCGNDWNGDKYTYRWLCMRSKMLGQG